MGKRYFTSLMLGFGAALGVFVAVTMPPGSWAVVIGVMLGLLACVPVILVMLVFVSRSPQPTRVVEQAPQPPVIIMPPAQYALPDYGYPYQQIPQPAPRRRETRPMAQQPLPSKRRSHYDGYGYIPAQDYYVEEEYYYPEVQARPEYYDAYYGQPGYYVEERPVSRKRRRQSDPGVVDGEFRTLGNE